MNREQIKDVLEIVGAAAIVASLVFVALEIRTNTQSNQIAIEQNYSGNWLTINSQIVGNDQFADVVEHATWSDGITVETTAVDEPQLTMTFEEKGVKMGLAHGHQAKSNKIKDWFKDCTLSRHPIGEVDILNTGHYHHYKVEDLGAGRCWKQCPTLDGGSFWWWAKGGNGSIPGMLTYLIDPSNPRGWDWEKVLTP